MRWISLQQSNLGGSANLPQKTHIYFACKSVIEGKISSFIQGGIVYDKKKAEEYVSRVEQENRDFGGRRPLSEGRMQ
ncbi:MAG: hypothetical protein QXN37_00120 [Candidatus Anstonellaceae archaeon]